MPEVIDQEKEPAIFVADSITKVPSDAAGIVLVSGSHGGLYCGFLAAKAGLKAVILNDAGIGRDGAGLGSLPYLEEFGIAGACVAASSCRIGDGGDMMQRGEISAVNAIARQAGLQLGMSCSEAASRLSCLPAPLKKEPAATAESRGEIAGARRRIVLVDSASLVRSDDIGQIVVTGSHGGLLGGKASLALQVDGFAAVFNDAGIGRDEAGISRLPALDGRGIAAFTVSHDSARIGDARSSFADGVVSRINETARQLGAREGMPAQRLLLDWAAL